MSKAKAPNISNKTASLPKIAVDDAAKEYWESYYKDSDYGKLWVRDIPFRVAAALAETSRRTASKNAAPLSHPTKLTAIASVIDTDGVSLEGVATYANGRKTAFVVEFDHDGKVKSFDPLELAVRPRQ